MMHSQEAAIAPLPRFGDIAGDDARRAIRVGLAVMRDGTLELFGPRSEVLSHLTRGAVPMPTPNTAGR